MDESLLRESIQQFLLAPPIRGLFLCQKDIQMNIFKANHGMQRRGFHVVDSLFVYAIDAASATLTKCGDAVSKGKFAALQCSGGGQQYLTKDKYVAVSVSQNGYKMPTYNSMFIIELGGDYITKVKAYGAGIPHNKDDLYFEALGKPVSPAEISKLGMDFIFKNTRTPPKDVEHALITITPTKATQSRGIAILKKGENNVV